MKISHVNPNCKDASSCNPHGEFGEVTYMTWQEKFDNFIVKRELKKEYMSEPCRLCDICVEDIKHFICDTLMERQSELLRKYEETIDFAIKERDKEWLSCLPENDDGEHWHSIETWNNIFISEAKAKKLI